MAITEYFIRYLQRRDEIGEKDLERLRSCPTLAYRPRSRWQVPGVLPRRRVIARGIDAQIKFLTPCRHGMDDSG